MLLHKTNTDALHSYAAVSFFSPSPPRPQQIDMMAVNLIIWKLIVLQRGIIDRHSQTVKSKCSHQSTVRFQVYHMLGFVAMDTAGMKGTRDINQVL